MTSDAVKKVQFEIAAILTTLRELNTDTPESIIYLALGMDINRYDLLRRIMESSGLINVNNHRISLTAKGIEIADQLLVVMGKQEMAEASYGPAPLG